MLSENTINWDMKKQQSDALPTCEAEIIASSLAACEAVYMRGLLTNLGFPLPGPTELRKDKCSAINLAQDLLSHAKSTKHIHHRELKIRELVADGTFKPKYVKSEDNTADIFTKPL
eukprot:2464215-Pleurochrysis_carterae.AAC.2